MKLTEQEIVSMLLESDEEFQVLHKEHQEMEKKLQEFGSKIYLTPEEEMMVKKLKKQKLQSKDKMYEKINMVKKNHEMTN